MGKWITTILLALMMITTATALMCENPIIPSVNCTMLTPNLNCSVYTYDIINLNGTIINNGSLNALNGSIYYFGVNLTIGDYIARLCDGTTRELKVNGEDDNMYLAIMGAIALVVWLMMKFSFELDKDHLLLKLLFSCVAMIFVIGGLNASIAMLTDSGASATLLNAVNVLYKAFLWIFYIFMAYIVFYYVYKLILYINDNFIKKGK